MKHFRIICLLILLSCLCLGLVAAQEAITLPWVKTTSKPFPVLKAGSKPWEVTLTFPATKSYKLSMSISPLKEAASGEIQVDGEALEKFKLSPGQSQVEIPPLFIIEGDVTISIVVKKGSIELLSVKIYESLKMHEGPVVSTPVNPTSSTAVKALMKFFADNYGKMIIAGQQDLTWDDKIDMVQRVKDQTGKEPALLGFDFLNLVNGRGGEGGRQQVDEAIAWHKRGGIVAFCWHWRVGSSREFYSNKTDFRIPTKSDDPAWALIDADIDTVALELKKLQAAGVPVLWRPLHEASGGWFWWGASGPRLFIQLWDRVYKRLVNVHGLNNLIWVWNGQHPDWYPGDETVDVLGVDIYGDAKQYLSFRDSWIGAQGTVLGNQGKVVALTENGPIPDPDKLLSEKTPWMWFMTWNDGNRNKEDDDYFSGNKYMDLEFKKKVYNHSYVLTLDELQAIKTW